MSRASEFLVVIDPFFEPLLDAITELKNRADDY
jgi:hypothetical protein